ncbi:MAG: TIGR00730 family Rossman fold protein [Methylacidiphilales bacterium]|nr:TIGR00730 family Rossman fold protein [Candidatus Methylacidiphilales bacterium]
MNHKKQPYTTGKPKLETKIDELLKLADVHADYDKIREMIVTVLKFNEDEPHPADIFLLNRAFKEMRYANRVFQPYRGVKKVCIFGSARTQPDEAAYKTAHAFGHMMMESGYMVITGGGDGIMGAAQSGAGRDRSFALNIRLPFEQKANNTIAGDSKLINFHYFFTRKLNFAKNSDAVALFPGGFGTMDEGFEIITLLQTGKMPLIPILMVDAPKGNFWRTFEHYLREHLLGDGMISESDFNLFKITDDLVAAQKEILNFYYNFHSYRYVGDELVIRTQREIPPAALKRLVDDFSDILEDKDSLRVCSFLPEEINEPEIAHLPRLCLKFDRKSNGRLRQLIDRINQF